MFEELKGELEALQKLAEAGERRLMGFETRFVNVRAAVAQVRKELDLDAIISQLQDARVKCEIALARKVKVQDELAADLAGDEAERIESEVAAEVEVEFSINAEELKAAKRPNNQAARDAEAKRRLATHKEYQLALRRQDAAKSELRNADMELNIAERDHQTMMAVLKAHTALAQAWAI